VEGLARQDAFYGGAVAIVVFVVPLVAVPSMTSTIVSAWTDRALDAERLNLRPNRPQVEEAFARVADYYRQRGVGAAESSRMASSVLGGSVRAEATALGIRRGLRFLSLTVGGVGLLVTGLLFRGAPAKPA
jgi:hypothetical protein